MERKLYFDAAVFFSDYEIDPEWIAQLMKTFFFNLKMLLCH